MDYSDIKEHFKNAKHDYINGLKECQKEITRLELEDKTSVKLKIKEQREDLDRNLDVFIDAINTLIADQHNQSAYEESHKAKRSIEDILQDMKNLKHNTDGILQCFDFVNYKLKYDFTEPLSQKLSNDSESWLRENKAIVFNDLKNSRYDVDKCTPATWVEADKIEQYSADLKEEVALNKREAAIFGAEYSQCTISTFRIIDHSIERLQPEIEGDSAIERNYLAYQPIINAMLQKACGHILEVGHKIQQEIRGADEEISPLVQDFRYIRSIHVQLSTAITTTEEAICRACNDVVNQVWCYGSYSWLCSTASLHQDTHHYSYSDYSSGYSL